MPDINLLQDTRKPEDKFKKKTVLPPKIEMTRPDKETKKEEKGKTPSSASMFFKSLFSRQPKKRVEEKLTPYAAEAKLNGRPIEDDERVIVAPPISAKIKGKAEDVIEEKEPEDIFEKKNLSRVKDILGEIEEPEKTAQVIKEEKESKKDIKPIKEEITPLAEEHSSFLVNLLPEELAGQAEPRQKLIYLAIVALAAIVVIGAIYGFMVWYQSSISTKTADVKAQRTNVETQISDNRETQKKAIALKQETDMVKELLNKHIYWTKFFDKLEKYIIDDVYLTGSFTGSTSSQISLSAIGKDFDSVAKQLTVLNNAPDFVSGVTITSAQKSGEATSTIPGATVAQGVSFTIDLQLVDDIFYKTEDEFTAQEGNLNQNINLNTNTNTNINTNSSL